jgi:hypothetical protein
MIADYFSWNPHRCFRGTAIFDRLTVILIPAIKLILIATIIEEEGKNPMNQGANCRNLRRNFNSLRHTAMKSCQSQMRKVHKIPMNLVAPQSGNCKHVGASGISH